MNNIKQFDSKDLAATALETARLDDPTEFCPLIKGRCKKECVCYVEPYIRELTAQNPIVWRVEGGYCSNGMFQDRPELSI